MSATKKAQAAKPTLGDRIIQRANDGYHNRLTKGPKDLTKGPKDLTKGPKDYPPFALTAMEDRIRWSKYIKTIADEIEAEDYLS